MKKKISERLSDTLGVPKDVIMDIPRITIIGDKEIYIENHKGVRELSGGEITIGAGDKTITIYGRGLVVSGIRQEDILISGVFERIEYGAAVPKKQNQR